MKPEIYIEPIDIPYEEVKKKRKVIKFELDKKGFYAYLWLVIGIAIIIYDFTKLTSMETVDWFSFLGLHIFWLIHFIRAAEKNLKS